jgi:glycosylphosphatidylinositol transamidase (GPIT) subunit GPI8
VYKIAVLVSYLRFWFIYRSGVNYLFALRDLSLSPLLS